MRYSLIIFLVLLCSFETPRLVKTKLSDGITASIPADFKPMDDLDFTQRYPSVRAPLAAYTNPDREVDFSVNISATQWPDGNLDLAGKFFKAGLNNLFDKVDFIKEGVREIHGKKYIFFEFESRMNGIKTNEGQRSPILKYTVIQYLVEKKRTLVFSFNCSSRLKDEWRSTADSMMKSIKVK